MMMTTMTTMTTIDDIHCSTTVIAHPTCQQQRDALLHCKSTRAANYEVFVSTGQERLK